MSSSFHNADRRTYRKVMVVGLLFCVVFVVFSFFAREQPANTYVLKKADKLVRTAGSAVPAN
jgi:amino acid permease